MFGSHTAADIPTHPAFAIIVKNGRVKRRREEAIDPNTQTMMTYHMTLRPFRLDSHVLCRRRHCPCTSCDPETRWKGAKTREIGEGVKLSYNGEDPQREGVAIAVAESLKDYVSAVNRISDRIMAVRIDTKEGYCTSLSLYAPQAGCSKREKNDFYLSLDDAIRSIPEGDYLTISHYLNGHITESVVVREVDEPT
ncbi:hypothetical protein TELCIR_11748 [Teladorsagia circumcincta]|uniref:Uncharacterized protein n=1 Tax=Teladorsagia circumcincta TaxID=45464 RepID=A0A2G9U8D1_TELCI|nr:hypothetical protein TELCIR_11748 [Teladorsagia circumcincta]